MSSSPQTFAPLVLTLAQRDRAQGAALATALGGTAVHRPDSARALVQDAFVEGRAIVGFCAVGILLRLVTPLLGDKRQDPPLVAVANGFAVPLLGGHQGGNRLAKAIATQLGIQAVITTASDERLGVALDDPPDGWLLANPQDAQAVVQHLVQQASADLGDAPDWISASAIRHDPHSPVALTRSPSARLHLRYLRQGHAVLGLGCVRGAAEADIRSLAEQVLAQAELQPRQLAALVSVDLKQDEPGMHALARRWRLPLRFYSAEQLEAQRDRLVNPSKIVFSELGCHGVAEAAALAAVGAQGQLVVPKQKSRVATAALASAPHSLDLQSLGRWAGELWIVGIGPGDLRVHRDALTFAAAQALRRADCVIGYGLYLDLAGALIAGKPQQRFDLGDEVARCRAALDAAATGQRVALLASGDPQIYAMASLVHELLNQPDAPPAWRSVSVQQLPGITALQAAAAALGAPLGHDFCAISLSDLMTPWQSIEQRIEAAAAGDFVVGFYNPVSQRRDWQLTRALEILRQARPARTPVAVCRQIERPEAEVRVTELARFDPSRVDMLSLVLVGSSQTRFGRQGLYTPRGYGSRL